MFEDSTFESEGRIRTRSRGWMMAAFAFNGSILLTLILIPLIYPEALPRQMISILLEAPPAPVPEPPAPPEQKTRQAFHGVPEMDGRTLVAPPRIPRFIERFAGSEGPAPINYAAMDAGGDEANGIRGAFQGQRPNIAPVAPKGPVRVASTIVAGLILHKTMPVYPPLAVAMRLEGAVLLQATISATGTIENLRVVSGHPMLQQAALDAVRNWRYRPFLLNDQPVEVETTVKVIFTLGR